MCSCFGLFSVVTEIAAQRLSSIVHHARDNLRRQLRTPFRASAMRARLIRLGWNVRFICLNPGRAATTRWLLKKKAGKGTRARNLCQ
jgi:hypothetical protein